MTDIYPETTVAEVFQNRVRQNGAKACVGAKNRQGGFDTISWERLDGLVRATGLYLISQGIKPGDKVAIFSPNRYEWWVADMAIISIGAVNVPIYATNTVKEARYILEHADVRICFAGTQEHLAKVLEARAQLPLLQHIICFDEPGAPSSGVLSLAEAQQHGGASADPHAFDARLNAIKPEDIATIIYTSGTTGDPKGVMLSHQNLLTNIHQHFAAFPIFMQENHTILSFLPLSHVFERTLGYYGAIYASATVYFAESIATVLDDLRLSKPTLFATVPRLLEKIRAGVYAKVATAPPGKQKLFNWAMSVGARNVPSICNGRARRGLFALEYRLADLLIFSKLKAALGLERLRYVGCGGAPLNPQDAEFFLGMDIHILEGFGLSETSPVTNFNTLGHIRLGTVGRPVKDTVVKIGPDDEILIKGPQLMVGYYKNPTATAEAFTAEGFLKTGDTGRIDAEGNLSITGRIKDLIITSGGKNIAPQNLENSLKGSKYIEQAAIIGERRAYLTALIVPAFPELEAWAEKAGVTWSSREELIAHPKVKQLFDGIIDVQLKDYARVEQVKKYRLLTQEWSQETAELTPTLKLKRRVITSKYAPIIDEMYRSAEV